MSRVTKYLFATTISPDSQLVLKAVATDPKEQVICEAIQRSKKPCELDYEAKSQQFWDKLRQCLTV